MLQIVATLELELFRPFFRLSRLLLLVLIENFEDLLENDFRVVRTSDLSS